MHERGRQTQHKKPHFISERKTTGGQGVHREVESEGHEVKYRAVIEGATPLMKRSAKDGARSSLHYGGEGILIHPAIVDILLDELYQKRFLSKVTDAELDHLARNALREQQSISKKPGLV
jgi:hypothetical protein